MQQLFVHEPTGKRGKRGRGEAEGTRLRDLPPAALLFPMVFGQAPRTAAGLVLILLVVEPRVAAAYALVPLAPRRLAGLGLSTAGTRGPRRAAALFGSGATNHNPPCHCSCLPVPRGASASEGSGLRAAHCALRRDASIPACAPMTVADCGAADSGLQDCKGSDRRYHFFLPCTGQG